MSGAKDKMDQAKTNIVLLICTLFCIIGTNLMWCYIQSLNTHKCARAFYKFSMLAYICPTTILTLPWYEENPVSAYAVPINVLLLQAFFIALTQDSVQISCAQMLVAVLA